MISLLNSIHIKSWNYILIGIAVVYRLRAYLTNRSLMHDEASLSINIVERSFIDLLDVANYYGAQIAPIGWTWTVKFLTTLFGNSEYVLRLLPLFAGLAAIILMYRLLRSIGGESLALVGLLILAFSQWMIYYSSEVKQYSMDAFCSLIAFVFLIRMTRPSASMRESLGAGLIGALLLWYSQPFIFVLAAIGALRLYEMISKKEWTSLAPLSLVGGLWLVSFSIEYIFFLHPSNLNKAYIDATVMFHRDSFMPLLPLSKDELLWFWYAFLNMFEHPVGLKLTGLAGALFAFGCYTSWKERRLEDAIYVLPLLFALIASGIKLYPFYERLLLFAAPGIIIILARGIHTLGSFPKYGKALMVISLVFLMQKPIFSTTHFFLSPNYGEDIKVPMSYIKEYSKAGDHLYVYYGALHGFKFYKKKYIQESVSITEGTYNRQDYLGYNRELEKLKGKGRVWILFTHVHPWDGSRGEEHYMVAALDGIGTRIRELNPARYPGATCYLFEL